MLKTHVTASVHVQPDTSGLNRNPRLVFPEKDGLLNIGNPVPGGLVQRMVNPAGFLLGEKIGD